MRGRGIVSTIFLLASLAATASLAVMASLLAAAPALAATKDIGVLPARVQKQMDRGERYALLIGIGKYSDKRIPRLDYTSADARAMYDVLTDPRHGRFPKKNVQLLLDEKATAKEIRRAFTRLRRRARPQDMVVVFYSGHGAPEEGSTYWVPYDADISVTICQIMALRAARNAGIDVPRDTIDNAVSYVRRCQNPDGGFKYQLTSGGSAWPRSAAGVASLYYAGVYEDEAIDRGLDYLFASALPGRQSRPGAHFFYGHYYAVQTMYLAGGERWEIWWPAIRDEIIDLQNADGSWSDRHAGSSYGAAMALIILQMPKRYLPIFQK